VIGGTVNANWLPDGRFWYRAQTATGSEFRLVAPAARRMVPAFDHQRLAASLATASGATITPMQLPFEQITFNTRMDSVSFDVGQRRFRCDVGGKSCVAAGNAEGGGRGGRGGRAGGGGGGRGQDPLANLTEQQRADLQKRLDDINAKHPAPPRANVKDFVDHIDYIVKKIGIDHVGIASDFDGGGGVDGWADASETFNVTLELVRRGYTEQQIDKIWSGNLLRVMDAVQKVARDLQKSQ
jgi:hypothetical protein